LKACLDAGDNPLASQFVMKELSRKSMYFAKDRGKPLEPGIQVQVHMYM